VRESTLGSIGKKRVEKDLSKKRKVIAILISKKSTKDIGYRKMEAL
jgi:hypothetical protein